MFRTHVVRLELIGTPDGVDQALDAITTVVELTNVRRHTSRWTGLVHLTALTTRRFPTHGGIT